MIHTSCILKLGKDGAICVESNAQTVPKPKPRAQVELRAAVDRNPIAATSPPPLRYTVCVTQGFVYLSLLPKIIRVR